MHTSEFKVFVLFYAVSQNMGPCTHCVHKSNFNTFLIFYAISLVCISHMFWLKCELLYLLNMSE